MDTEVASEEPTSGKENDLPVHSIYSVTVSSF